MRYQQNLTSRTIAIVVLGNAQWPMLRLHVAHVVAAVNAATPGAFTEVDIPADQGQRDRTAGSVATTAFIAGNTKLLPRPQQRAKNSGRSSDT